MLLVLGISESASVNNVIVAIKVGVLLLFVGSTAWNRSLSKQVQTRTRAVERTERRYRDLVDNASDMIYRTDAFGRFTFVNPVATRILGFGESELLSMMMDLFL